MSEDRFMKVIRFFLSIGALVSFLWVSYVILRIFSLDNSDNLLAVWLVVLSVFVIYDWMKRESE